MDLSSLKIRLGIQSNEITHLEPAIDSPLAAIISTQTGTFHGIYRKDSERRVFISVCKQRILHPTISGNDYDRFWEWLAPSWYISNGYFEDYIEPYLLEFMLVLHGTKSTIILNKILHTINFITLFTPRDVQEELLIWISESSNYHTAAD